VRTATLRKEGCWKEKDMKAPLKRFASGRLDRTYVEDPDLFENTARLIERGEERPEGEEVVLYGPVA
jgi:hypothetical protein